MLVEFEDDALPERWQERMLLAKISSCRWVSLTPDLECNEVNLGEVKASCLMPIGLPLPPGIAEDEVCLVCVEDGPKHFLKRRALEMCIEEAEAEADETAEAEGGVQDAGAAGTSGDGASPGELDAEEPLAKKTREEKVQLVTDVVGLLKKEEEIDKGIRERKGQQFFARLLSTTEAAAMLAGEESAVHQTLAPSESLMVCPNLQSHVRVVLGTTAIMKSVGLARKERDVRRGRAKAKAGAEGGAYGDG